MSLQLKIFERTADLGISNDCLSSLSGIAASRLSMAARGLRDLDNESVIVLNRIVGEMEALASSVAPVPIDWRDVTSIKNALESRRTPMIGSNQ